MHFFILTTRPNANTNTNVFSFWNPTDLVFRPVGALALQHVDQVVGDRAEEGFHMKTLLQRDIIVVLLSLFFTLFLCSCISPVMMVQRRRPGKFNRSWVEAHDQRLSRCWGNILAIIITIIVIIANSFHYCFKFLVWKGLPGNHHCLFHIFHG